MDGDIAKRIFTKFLKERNLMGLTLPYYFGKPNFMGKSLLLSNTKVLNNSAKEADNSKVEGYIQKNLINMVGKTRTPHIMIGNFKHDYLYDVYEEWKNYVEKNWDNIYEEFYKK